VKPIRRIQSWNTQNFQNQQDGQSSFISPSRYKMAPYLTAYFNRTEIIVPDLAVQPWEPPDNGGGGGGEPYDDYVSTLNLDNWWKLSEAFDYPDTSGINSGTQIYPITRSGSSTIGLGYESQVSTVTNGTYDKKSIRFLDIKDLSISSSNVPFGLVTSTALGSGFTTASPFSLHGWFILEKAKTNYIFRTHNTMYYRGLQFYITSALKARLEFGNGGLPDLPNRRTYESPVSVVSLDTPTFIVVNCTPSTVAANNVFEVWVNGVKISMAYTSGTATTTSWPSGDNTNFGVYGANTGAQPTAVNYSLVGKIDQIGHINRWLTQTEIETMWDLGKF